MNNQNSLTCPNCGSAYFDEITPYRLQCRYCGTTVAQEPPEPETPSILLKCLQCGFNNEQDARYCKNCGAALSGWPQPRSKRIDLAIVSILVSFFGNSMFPLVGGGIGLYLAYKAHEKAQAGEGREDLARIAIVLGWVMIVLPAISICLGSGVWGYSLCASMFDSLSNTW